MNATFSRPPSSAFECSLKPFGRLSLSDPVFAEGARCLRGDLLRLSDCLLIRTMIFTPGNNGYSIRVEE